ncbi:MAG: hypothetical protein K6F64_07070 [Clostridia bacterium]|nr:hypothetical protein [Clostridia bacterium]
MKTGSYVSNISIIVITAIMTVFPLALGAIIDRFFPDTDGVIFVIASAVILSIIVGLIKCRFKWIFCVIPPTFMLIYGLIKNDIAATTLSPVFLAGMSAIVGAVTLIKKSVRKREKK